MVNIAAVLLSSLKSFVSADHLLLVCEEKTEPKVHGRLQRCTTCKRGKESEHCCFGGYPGSLRKSTLKYHKSRTGVRVQRRTAWDGERQLHGRFVVTLVFKSLEDW